MSDVTRVTECFTPNVAMQIAMKAAGRRKHVYHGGKLCSKCYGPKPVFRKDRYCGVCRAKYSKARRG